MGRSQSPGVAIPDQPLNPSFQPAVQFLFVDAELQPQVEPLNLEGIQVLRIDDSGTPDDPYEAFLAQGSPELVESWLEDEDETITINYTSDTTGNPKGVMYTACGSYLNALATEPPLVGSDCATATPNCNEAFFTVSGGLSTGGSTNPATDQTNAGSNDTQTESSITDQ